MAMSANPIKALLFTKTSGYRHSSIPSLVSAISSLFPSTSTDPSAFTHLIILEDSSFLPSTLPQIDVLILADTTGGFLPDQAEKLALKEFVDRGGGVVGVHASTAGEVEWQWYGDMMGAVFTGHPDPQWGIITVKDTQHFITSSLPSPRQPCKCNSSAPPLPPALASSHGSSTAFPWFDEWYNFRMPVATSWSRTDLIVVDEGTYDGGSMGDHHPLAWTQEMGASGARVFYTAMGHFDEAFEDVWFMSTLERGLYWVMRREGDLE